jgi:hypothetical protein
MRSPLGRVPQRAAGVNAAETPRWTTPVPTLLDASPPLLDASRHFAVDAVIVAVITHKARPSNTGLGRYPAILPAT